MAENIDNIELRSEKVRNIIGQIPPRIIRIGITVIFLIIIGILTGTYFFEYNYTIETTATIEQRNDTTFIQINIPANEKNKIKKGHKVVLSFDNIQNLYNKRLETEIQKIPNTLIISKNEGFYIAEIEIIGKIKTSENETLKIQERKDVKAEIITDKISFFDRIIKPFKNIMNARK
jgi:hypothetical protein